MKKTRKVTILVTRDNTMLDVNTGCHANTRKGHTMWGRGRFWETSQGSGRCAKTQVVLE